MKTEINENQFVEYERCRLSGVTNMFDLRMVNFITGLEKEEIVEIMKNYSELKKKYRKAVDRIKQES